MDAIIIGAPRSGTTLLANLMSSKEDRRWVMTEPIEAGGVPGLLKDKIGPQCKEWFGIEHNGHARNYEDLAPLLSNGLKAWGAKEVVPERWEWTIKRFNPRLKIVIVRNLVRVAWSLYDFDICKQPQSIDVRCLQARIDGVLSFVKQNSREEGFELVHYDELMNPVQRRLLAEVIDWPLDGDPGFNFVTYGRKKELRDGIFERPKEGPVPKVVMEFVEKNARYQKRFGFSC